MRWSLTAFAAIATGGVSATFAGPTGYDVSLLLDAQHPFANVACCGLWPDAGPVRPTLPPEAGLRGHDIRPLLAQPHPFADQATGWSWTPQPPGQGVPRSYDMGQFLAEPHPFDAGPASTTAAPPISTPSVPAAQIATEGLPRDARAQHAHETGWRNRMRPYIGASAGMTWLQDADNAGAFLTVGSSYDPGFHVAGTVGSQFASGLRLEFELAYRQVGLDTLRVTRAGNIAGLNIGPVSADGVAGVLAFMFNAAWEFDLGGEVRPFVLAGIGPARVTASGVRAAGVSVVDDSAVVFAWQLGIGGSYRLTESWILDASYRWFATTDPTLTDSAGDRFDSEVMSHDFLLGVRYLF
jgi:opacity protein-like surface antigen